MAKVTLTFAYTQADLNSIIGQTGFYDPNDTGTATGTCSTTTPAAATPSNSKNNVDYAGRQILSDTQLSAISANKSFYVDAAAKADIPWQMIAVVHLRESGLKRNNPGNGQGIYQFVNKNGGPYPSGPVDDTEFARQTLLAADFLKAKASSSTIVDHKVLTAAAKPDTVKDVFFSYNGRAGAYLTQATTLGYASDQGYEGSPYVMNKADAKRDPVANPSGWGQIISDGGGLSYPANSDYGAFVEYAALTGLAIGSACAANGQVDCSGAGADASLSAVRQAVICIAEKENTAWTSGQIKAGIAGYGKYSQGVVELWCADFTSWVYNEAKYPIGPAPRWRVPAVDGVRATGVKDQSFHWHPAAAGYLPRPGDLVIHSENGSSHINLVAGVSGNTLTMIGGDQKADARGYPDGSIVNKYTVKGFVGVDDITGYVSPD